MADRLSAAAGVVIDTAEALTLELSAINENRHRLRLLLRGLSGLRGGTESTRMALQLVTPALNDPERVLPMSGGPLIAMTGYWNGFLEALLSDSEAVPADHPQYGALKS